MKPCLIQGAIIACLIAVAAGGPPATALGQDPPTPDPADPEHNFEILWRTFDRNYALFGPKRVDWSALYRVYRPQVSQATSDAELFDVMSRLLGHLNDNHVRLSGAGRSYRSGILSELNGAGFEEQEMEDFSIGLIRRNYLRGELQERHVLQYGWLQDSIGYLRIRGFSSPAASARAMDAVLAELGGARAFVIDLRATPGGDDRVGREIASRFADTKRLYMKTYERNGPGHADFAPPKYWYVEPAGPKQFTGPIAVVTNRWGISAAENFALAMRVLPHATQIGDLTSGVFADVYGDRLPNGWQFGVSYKLFADPTGFCWEGIGVPADLRIVNSPRDIEAGTDRVLEFAMEFLRLGSPTLKDIAASLQERRDSWAQLLERKLADSAVDRAVERALATLAQQPEAFYVDEDELMALSARLHRGEKRDAAFAVLEVAAQQFSDSPRPYQTMGDAYAALGQQTQAKRAYSQALTRNRKSYPWEKQAAQLAEAVVSDKEILWLTLERADTDEDFADAARMYRFDPASFFVAENPMNSLGYRLLQQNHVDRAIEVFRINAEVFPRSANVWDSLGDGYRAAGNREAAIRSYEMALEIDPTFAASRQNLEAMRRR